MNTFAFVALGLVVAAAAVGVIIYVKRHYAVNKRTKAAASTISAGATDAVRVVGNTVDGVKIDLKR